MVRYGYLLLFFCRLMEAGLNKRIMYNGTYAPWEHYPKTLRHYEVENPMSQK
jgi:hypothetical protein